MVEIFDRSFANAISEGCNVVYFYTNWCNPCKNYEPILYKLKDNYPHANFYKLNADGIRTIGDVGINTVPTTILYHNGNEIERFSGAKPEMYVTNTLDSCFHKK